MKQKLAYYEVESTPPKKRLCQRIKHRFVVFVVTNSNIDIMQVICIEQHMIMVNDEDHRW